ncbi:MAG: hypothetical protein JXR91_14840 [Deltaproteobacteria bacterium]|nr:hypothetical protein [Deltaproteobacteria bacterium]
MLHCSKCGRSTSMITDTCPYCGYIQTSIQNIIISDKTDQDWTQTDSEKGNNPNLPQFSYDVSFGIGQTIGETFNIWSNSLGKLILINLIPAVPIIIVAILAIIMLISSILNLFDGNFSFLDTTNLANFLGTLGVGTIGVAAAVLISIIILIIPALAGHFIIINNREYFKNNNTSVFKIYLSGFKYILPVIGFFFIYNIILSLIIGIPVSISIAASAIFSPVKNAIIVFQIFAVLFLLPVIIARLSIVIPLMIIEKANLIKAIFLSNSMINGHTGSVIGIYTIFLLIMLGVNLVSGILGFIPAIGQLANIAIQLAISPLFSALTFAIYAGLKSQHSK